MRIEENGPVQWQDVQMWLPVSDGHGPLDASYLAIHETAEPGATAADHIHHWTFNDSKYAVHYVADWESDTVYRAVPDDRLAYHVGSGNKYCVGIELCHATNYADFQRVWDVAVDFAAWYLNERGWGIDSLISHHNATDWWGGSDHTDPDDYFESYGESWDSFKACVVERMQGGVSPDKPTDDETEDKMQFLFQPGDIGMMCFFDGTKIIKLSDPDQMQVIIDCYKVATGKDIAIFKLGTHEAPWYQRLKQCFPVTVADANDWSF